MTARRLVVLIAALAGVAALFTRRGRKARRRVAHRTARQARHLAGRARGVAHTLSRRGPAPDIDLRTLADRVRSGLGPVEKRLDLPRVHVMVEDHMALLHGTVGTEEEARQLEEAARRVPGIDGVESYLHVGLLPGDTRPSHGRAIRQQSPALDRLLTAARDAGADQHTDRALVRAVVATLVERLPAAERGHLLTHLPPDVRALAEPPRRHGHAPGRIRSVTEFVAATGADSIEPGRATLIVESVVGTLRQLVPDEAADIAAVLPAELRAFWRSAVPG